MQDDSPRGRASEGDLDLLQREGEKVKRGCAEERATSMGDDDLLRPFHRHVGEAATSPGRMHDSLSKCEGGAEDKDIGNLGMGQVDGADKKVRESQGQFGMEDVFVWLGKRLDFFKDRLCKVVPKGKVFPLPTSYSTLSRVFPQTKKAELCCLRVLVVSLNSLNGEGCFDESPHVSPFQQRILGELLEQCERVCSWPERANELGWEEFFRFKGVDYRGDEILSAQWIQWENVAPALPPEIGAVDLEAVVELGSRVYVQNFEQYLLDPEDQVYVRPPKVMVHPDCWASFCKNMMARGVFGRVHEDDVYRVNGKLLLNGLFGVTKHEFDGAWEVMRIIMNLIPVNAICRTLDSDIATLPTWSGMSALELLSDEELVISSEDVRCFFYIFKVPSAWHQFMAFNKPLPPDLNGDKAGTWYPCSAVLPMGFKNSVSIAQHIHRVIAKQALGRAGLGGELELRKDKCFTRGNPMYRVYLDNFDELRKVSKGHARLIAGEVSPLVSSLREEYAEIGVPRHPKKSVASQSRAEVQGAIVDGRLGVAYPKPEKVLRYCQLARLLLLSSHCTQKQMQVVGGGLVYVAMFRRPLLGCLNHVWTFITAFDKYPPFIKLEIPGEVKEEMARFLGLLPLAFLDFRCALSSFVTASDASSTGGGVTVSQRLTPAGCVAAQCRVRGDIVEPADVTAVLTVGLFDGISGLRVAADALGWNVVGHVSVEKSVEASRVVESRFPHSIHVSDVSSIDADMVKDWSLRFSQVGVVLLGAGPPCQGVSGLNAARKGALRDARSCLFTHVSRVRELLKAAFPWAQIQTLMESVASMDSSDEEVMSDEFGCKPWFIDAGDVSLAHRPRLYWIEWELVEDEDVKFETLSSGRSKVKLIGEVEAKHFLTPGWKRVESNLLPTFTTSRPKSTPGYKPAGIKQCTPAALQMWENDAFRFPPYQYMPQHCLQNKQGRLRVPNIEEREVIMGFPKGFTTQCMVKSKHGTVEHQDCRLSLLGNSWNVTVVAWLLSQLGKRLGLNSHLSVQEIISRTSPGCTTDFQSFLQRPLMSAERSPIQLGNEAVLVRKLCTLVSVKGDDLMLKASTEDQVRYQRLRASIPAKLWRWRTVCGWQWTGTAEHINVLELRAVLTALKWRIESQKMTRSKFVHLVDSLVCLHCLSRGRSSSRKLRRTMLRINSLLLATGCHVVWAYVHTKDNPADAPSRRPRKRKWAHA